MRREFWKGVSSRFRGASAWLREAVRKLEVGRKRNATDEYIRFVAPGREFAFLNESTEEFPNRFLVVPVIRDSESTKLPPAHLVERSENLRLIGVNTNCVNLPISIARSDFGG